MTIAATTKGLVRSENILVEFKSSIAKVSTTASVEIVLKY
jgi:hypothetical protein